MREQLGQLSKRHVIAVGVGGLQRGIHRLLPHGVQLLRVPDAKRRRKPEHLPVLTQQIQAKRIQRADDRTIQKLALSARRRIQRVFGYVFGQLLQHALLHLLCGGAGKSDNQQPVCVDGCVVIQHAAHRPLGQYGGLAAARRGGNQNHVSARFNGAALFVGPVCVIRHRRFPPRSK
ncbi:hypothetical protein SDC9_145397 [bioreactor metagenome]|uniref:Uncharacterized protein n=1 Tax=bioreactor metagenome TaxID=1076179 RepID=A0A645EBQ4_9ZZZZ